MSANDKLQQDDLHRQLEASNAALQNFMNASRIEAEMAAHLFYNNLLAEASEDFNGVTTYLKSKSDFCGDLILKRSSPSGSVFVLHVDAMGQGLSATVTLLPVMDLFHNMVDKGYALPMIIRQINKHLNFLLPPDRFVAASLLEVDFLHEQASIWNGGMPDIYLLDKYGQVVTTFASQHLALGILENSRFDAGVERFVLPEQGGIFAASDGLTEQRNQHEDPYGSQRLLSELSKGSLHFITSRVVAALKEFSGLPSFDDDVSLYFLSFKELANFWHQQAWLSKSSRNLSDIHPFTWELTLKGRQLAEQEVAHQCNQLLQQMGMPQPWCQRAFTVISELSTNAVDHGILGLSSRLKSFTDGFAEYYTQRDQLVKHLSADKQLRVKLDWSYQKSGPRLQIEVEQIGGQGFDYEKVLQKAPGQLSGRGLMLVRRLTSSLEFAQAGCAVTAILE